jgi:hypothetical protein
MTSPADDRPLRTPLRAFALFTTLRLLLFLVAFLAVRLVVEDTLLAVAVAVVVSALVGVPVLRPYREDLNRALVARRQQD